MLQTTPLAPAPVRWRDDGKARINAPESYGPPLPGSEARLGALAAKVQSDLHALRHPEAEWMPTRTGANGVPMLDVLVIGAGQGGLSIAAHLLKERVTNIMVVDREPAGAEGIWNSHGRMPVIRSPKHYPGPDMGVPNLTYEAWHRAAFGDISWEGVNFVPITLWVDYLSWVRRTLELPVRNATEVTSIVPAVGGLAVTIQGAGGSEVRHTRRLVLATGHDGTGDWWMPDYLTALPENLRAKAADPIDFQALDGKRVAVLGVGATAGDNAICALEHGAEVHMFCRRPTHRRQQVYRWCITPGFLRHFCDLDDAWRWRFMHYILNIRMGMPPETWKRASSHPNFTLHTSTDWNDATPNGDGVLIETTQGRFEADYIISCAGHDQDVKKRPELAHFAEHIALWGDRYAPPDDLDDNRLGRYPYLGSDFQFLEKTPGSAPYLERIHDFTFGPTMSFGPSGCSISTLRLTVPMLVSGVTKGLFVEDAELHWQALLDHPNMIP
ncbi:MAG: NAD(P)/FAD-dependent oxidoreductase [Alphaproteobacteria bacterium]|nr:NAD(P)/FAD-dependent oxidoreductase [Alphaproteobacteria bacterium]